jgi:hypothetical protein
VRTTVNLPEPLLESAKRRAAARGVTVSTVIEDALRIHLREGEASAPPFRLFTVRGRLVNPNLNLDRTSELITGDDQADYPAREK